MHIKDPKVQELEQTIYKYKRTVYGIAITQLKNKYEADDVFQEVFLLYFIKQPSFDNAAEKKAWLIKATINKCRQQNFSKWNKHIDKSSEPDAAQNLEASADKDIYSAVRELPYKLREAVYLHYFLGLTVSEAADMLGVKANTMSMRLSKARKLLQKRLE